MTTPFEILGGLPATGPLPEPFSATGTGTHSEGLVVRFVTSTGEAWIGNFQGGYGTAEGDYADPTSNHLIVVSSGQAYIIDADRRTLIRTFGGGLHQVVPVPDLELLVFSDGIRLEAVGTSGLVWETKRLSWDVFRGIHVSGMDLKGEAFDSMCNVWHPFEVDLATGEAQGGSFADWPAKT